MLKNGLRSSLKDEGWSRRNSLTAVLNFSIFNGTEKNSNSTQFIPGIRSKLNLNHSIICFKHLLVGTPPLYL